MDDNPDTTPDETPDESQVIDPSVFVAKISDLEATIVALTEELKAAKLVNYELLMAARTAEPDTETDSDEEEIETMGIEELFA